MAALTPEERALFTRKSVAALGFDVLAVLEGQGDAIASELRAVRERLAEAEAEVARLRRDLEADR